MSSYPRGGSKWFGVFALGPAGWAITTEALDLEPAFLPLLPICIVLGFIVGWLIDAGG